MSARFFVLLGLALPCVAFNATQVAEDRGCWKHAIGRGAGKPLSACPNGMEEDAGLCYPPCPAGMVGVGPVCWGICPEGFTDTGVDCLKPKPYGRGAGHFTQSACEKKEKKPCEKDGALWYPVCDANFHNEGCCICSPDCPAGFKDVGISCQKPTKTRSAGKPMICKPDEDESGALCYPKCKSGFTGNGPVCWQDCSGGYSDCGAFCYYNCPADIAAISLTVFDIVAAVAISVVTDTELEVIAIVGTLLAEDKLLPKEMCALPSSAGHLSALPMSTALTTQVAAADAGCWKHAKARGVGKPLSVCPDGMEKDGLLCYPPCPAGMVGVGPVCWGICPEGFTDTGMDCLKPAPYGRGSGHFTESACVEKENKPCEKNGLLWYPVCDANYHNVGCCVCSPNCPAGWTDIGISCAKPTQTRTAGKPMICKPDEDESAGLCYSKCATGWTGNGPVCWQDCSASLNDCGAFCFNDCPAEIAAISLTVIDLVVAVAISVVTDTELEVIAIASAVMAKMALPKDMCPLPSAAGRRVVLPVADAMTTSNAGPNGWLLGAAVTVVVLTILALLAAFARVRGPAVEANSSQYDVEAIVVALEGDEIIV